MQKITKLWKFCDDWSSKLQENNENENQKKKQKKNAPKKASHHCCKPEVFYIWVINYLFLKNNFTSEEAISQQLSIAL